jgi:ribosomal protein S6--L-glutamate ligase
MIMVARPRRSRRTDAACLLIITEDGESWMAEPLQRRFAARGRCELRSVGSACEAEIAEFAAQGLVFVRSRSVRLVRVLDQVERRGGTVINAASAIRRTRHRATAMARVAAAGVPTALDYEGPLAGLPFARAVLKSRFDSGQPAVALHDGCAVVGAAANVTAGPAGGRQPRLIYAQELIAADWEHKIYLVGEELFAFVQRPTLLVPDKFATRQRVAVDPALAHHTRRAAAAMGLEVAGVDFLVDRAGVPRVTDVNSNQGLHTFTQGYEALERHLLHRLSGRV